MTESSHKLAILDDYQGFSNSADWSRLSHIPRTTFTTAIPKDDVVSTLLPFTMIHAMRERTKFPAAVLKQLPNLKFITTTGMRK